ncbi:unknown [Ruminococcus sp. CAG:624]|nr:unknown [Ruminococcus sp. CAG:624]
MFICGTGIANCAKASSIFEAIGFDVSGGVSFTALFGEGIANCDNTSSAFSLLLGVCTGCCAFGEGIANCDIISSC